METYLKDAWEDSLRSQLFFATLALRVDVLGEAVEQVVNDVGRENLDSVLVGLDLGLGGYFHVEAENRGVLFVLREEGLLRLGYVLLVHGPDVDGRDRDLARVQELQKRFEGADGRRLHAHSVLGLVHVFLEDVDEVAFNLGEGVLHLLLRVAAEEL